MGNAYMLAKPGECYLVYFADKTEVTIKLPDGGDHKVDLLNTRAKANSSCQQ